MKRLNSYGFTLLELVISLTIFSVASLPTRCHSRARREPSSIFSVSRTN
ncbi:MAG: prepilin-type N-terminal cleavage/methylation domain-containing protein [Deltaproteobacteria bacterium]|nr:prepilin-type N-terminal cleavage/methylation domain-containing protein [Deltaproteobacteria bacterium]